MRKYRGIVSANRCSGANGVSTASYGIQLSNNVQRTNVTGNNVYATAGVAMGTGTGNLSSNNLT